MTESELTFLKANIDQVVTIETTQHGPHRARILFVFDEGESPDVFYLEMEPGSSGELQQKGQTGYSVLLSEVISVKPAQAEQMGTNTTTSPSNSH